MRYELHRVVVQATLKPGERYIYGRRTFLHRRGQLERDRRGCLRPARRPWRVAPYGLIQCYDVQVPWYRFSIYHDLDSRSYITGGYDNEIRGPIRFGVRGKVGDFQPDALRRLGTN